MSKEVKVKVKVEVAIYKFTAADHRYSVQSKLGMPDGIRGCFGKRKLFLISQYGQVEFHFSPQGALLLIYSENELGELVLSEKFE